MLSFIKNKLKNIKYNDKQPTFSISLFFLFLILLVIKIIVIYISYINLSPFNFCLAYFISDFYFFITITFFITTNHFVKNKIVEYLINIIILILIILYCIDIFSIYYFQTRESLLTLSNFPQLFQISENGGLGFGKIIIQYTITLIISLVSIYLLCKIPKKRIKIFSPKIFIIFCIIGICFYFLQQITVKNNVPIVKNVLSINIEAIKKFRSNQIPIPNNKKYEDFIKYESGDNKNLNIILVFIESLSAIDSAKLGGNNNTPYLDKIQENGMMFPNFFSNGIDSHQAHVGTLLGIPSVIENYKYRYSYLNSQGLADFLNKQGYYTTFISTAALSFMKQRDFIAGIGFQTIIGEEEFENENHYTFNAAPDGSLYEMALKVIENQTGNYFIGLQTISLHKPYNTPIGKTEKLAIQYTDEKLYEFYEQLQNLGFFDNGILMIVGDHRKREPLEKGEFNLFGPVWKGKTIMTLIGSGIKAGTTNNNLIQHTDIYYSLKKLLGSGDIEMNKFYNDIFSSTTNRDRGIMDKASVGGFIDDTIFFFKNGKFYDIDYNHDNKEAYDYYRFLKNNLNDYWLKRFTMIINKYLVTYIKSKKNI